MLELISKNVLVILCTILSIMICLINYRITRLAEIVNIKDKTLPHSLSKSVWLPFRSLLAAFLCKGSLRRLFLAVLCILFALVVLVRLFDSPLPLWVGLLLFVPCTLVTVIAFSYLLWALTFLLRRLVDVENRKLNGIFSFVAGALLFLTMQLCCVSAGKLDSFGFYLTVCNLIFCYALIVISLKILLGSSSEKKTALTLRNMWKVALMQISFFLFVLTLLAYAGYLHHPSSYRFNGNFGLFEAFYHVVITFGTVGYGDVVPTCSYTRGVSILTVGTSVLSITILLSSMLSLSKKKE